MAETKEHGGQPDNDNAHTGSLVRGAFRRALAENEAQGRQSLLIAAHKVVEKAEQGDVPSAKLLFDKVDAQPGSKDSPLENNHNVTIRYVGG